MISFNEININYGKKIIIEDGSLELKKGVFYCFIGRNGAGKTSILKYLKSDTLNKLNTRMLMQNQESGSAYGMVIWDFLKSYCIFEKIIQWEETLSLYLKEFNLYDKRFQLICSLSGGEKQRMFLSQILLGKSDLILLDESFSNLDIEYKVEYYAIFKREAKKRNIPIILIEHDLRFALEFSENILIALKKMKSIKSYKSAENKLKDMIVEEFRIVITNENKYERVGDKNKPEEMQC